MSDCRVYRAFSDGSLNAVKSACKALNNAQAPVASAIATFPLRTGVLNQTVRWCMYNDYAVYTTHPRPQSYSHTSCFQTQSLDRYELCWRKKTGWDTAFISGSSKNRIKHELKRHVNFCTKGSMNMFLKVLSRFGSKILSSSLRFKVTACGLITCSRSLLFCRQSSCLKIHFAFTCFPICTQYIPHVFLKQSNNQSSSRVQHLRFFFPRLLRVLVWV